MLHSKKKAVIEIVIFMVLIFLSSIALVFLLRSKMAISTKEFQQYNIITQFEADNAVEIATANVISKIRENPSTTSFEMLTTQSVSGPLSSEMSKFHIKNHYKEDVYSYSYIDIIDSSSKININQDDKALFNIVMNLTKITGGDYLLKLLELKTSGKVASFVDILTPFRKEHRKIIRDFFTVDSYVNYKVVAPSNIEDRIVSHKTLDNIYTLTEIVPKNIQYAKKSYININTAKYEVIYSLLKDVSGIYLSKNIGDVPESEKENLNPIGKLTKVEINDNDARKIAGAIIDSRKQQSIKSWQQLESILKNANLSEEKIALILTNFNPNANLNFFYPPFPLFKRINKIDLINYTTEITFFPTGVFEFDVKVILARKDVKLAEQSIYVIKKIFDITELSNQSDFAKFESDGEMGIIDNYPLNDNIEFDGYLARKSLHSPTVFSNESFSISATNSLDGISSSKKLTVQNITDTKNGNLSKAITINNATIDITRSKEGFVLDAKNQYLITAPNVFNFKMDVSEEDKVFCSLANPLPHKKFNFKSEGYITGWFRCLDNIQDKNIFAITNMADVWSDRVSVISFRTSFSNPLIEFGGSSNLKYTFKSQSYLSQDKWVKVRLRWEITKNDKTSNIEFFLDNKKLDVEYFKNVKNFPISSFFGISNYKILALGLSIGYGEYTPQSPYFFGLFDSITISSKPPQTDDFKYNNKGASLKIKLNLKNSAPIFVSSSIYNGTIGIYYNDLPASWLGGNLFTFTAKGSVTDKSYLYLKFGHKETETGLTEIIDDVYIATINLSVISATTLFY